MSSLIRRLQKRLLTKAGVGKVPVFGRHGKVIGARHRLHAAHIGYEVGGTARLAPAPKPKRVRKPKAAKPAQAAA